MEQAVGGQAIHVAAIPLRRVEECGRQEPHLGHGEGLDFGGDVLAGELERIFEGQDAVHRALAFRLRGLLLLRFERGGGCRRGGEQHGKIAAAEGWLRVHGIPRWLESLTVCHVREAAETPG